MRIRIRNHPYSPMIYFPHLNLGPGSKSEEWLHFIEPLEQYPGNLKNLHKILNKLCIEIKSETFLGEKSPYKKDG